MTNVLLYIGRDADDINFHASAAEPSSGELLFFQMLAYLEGLAWVARQIKTDRIDAVRNRSQFCSKLQKNK